MREQRENRKKEDTTDTYKEKEIYNEARAKREKNELRANSEKIQKYDKYDTYKGNKQRGNNENEARAKPEQNRETKRAGTPPLLYHSHRHRCRGKIHYFSPLG